MKKPEMRNMFFYLPAAAHEALKILALRRRQSMGAILRELVADWVRRQKGRSKTT